MTCNYCKGSGSVIISGDPEMPCPMCHGTGNSMRLISNVTRPEGRPLTPRRVAMIVSLQMWSAEDAALALSLVHWQDARSRDERVQAQRRSADWARLARAAMGLEA